MAAKIRHLKICSLKIPLDPNEKPNAGYSLPIQGCNVELTEVQIVGHSGVWWTLGFEAFGELDTVPANLSLTLLPEKLLLIALWRPARF